VPLDEKSDENTNIISVGKYSVYLIQVTTLVRADENPLTYSKS